MMKRTCLLMAFLLSNVVAAATLTEMSNFGDNPGKLKMFKYVPDSVSNNPAFIVLLHGCTQGAADFDNETGWTKIADRTGAILLFPEQQRDNNGLTCFNWFLPEHFTRGQGEIASVVSGIKAISTEYSVNTKKVFVTGLSAGAAMTSALLANYPEIFKGGAIVAGLPYGCASDVMSGILCMNGINNTKTPEQWGNLVRTASNFRGARPVVQIWQGLQDPYVKPTNGVELEKQWGNVLKANLKNGYTEELNGYTKLSYTNTKGEVVLESYRILNAKHGYPVAQSQGCGQPGPYVIETGICAAEIMANFWDL